MIVSLAIFTVVALIAIGALLRVLDANRKSINLKTTINNLNFSLESMSREMRVGKKYYCDNNINSAITQNYNAQSCDITTTAPNQTWVIAFTSTKVGGVVPATCNLIYAYRFDGTSIQKAQQRNCNDVLNNNNGSFQNIIPTSIALSKTIVKVDNTNQPYTFLFLKGTSGSKKALVDFALQTTISQRIK